MSFQEYLSRGWSCFPLRPESKEPSLKWEKFQKRLPNQEEVDEWARAGGATDSVDQVAVVTGKVSGIIVLDIDGAEAWDWLAEQGVTLDQNTPIVCTNAEQRKYHYYYKHPGFRVPNRIKFLPGMDLRGDGGYVVAPPSRHPDGHLYHWSPNGEPESNPTTIPQWLMPFVEDPTLKSPKSHPKSKTTVKISPTDLLPPDEDWVTKALQGVNEGERNSTATKLAGYWCGMGMAESQVVEMVRSWNLRNTVPLPDKELLTITHSIATKEARKRAAGGESQGVTPRHRPKTFAERDAMLEGLSDRLGVKIESISKTTGDDPKWDFDLGDEVCVRMTTTQLFSQRQFQQKFLEQIDLMPIKQKKWDSVIQTVSDIADKIDAGEEATTTGALRLAVQDYLSNNPPEEWSDNKRPPYGYPFIFQEKSYLFKDELYKFLVNSKWMKISPQDLAQRMRNLHMSPQNPRICGFRPRVWEIHADLLPPGKKPDGPKEEPSVVVPFKQQGSF